MTGTSASCWEKQYSVRTLHATSVLKKNKVVGEIGSEMDSSI